MILEPVTQDKTEDNPIWGHAKTMALNSNVRFKLGAVLVKKGKIILSSYNIRKTHPKFGCGRYGTLHAESRLILKAINKGIDVHSCSVYVYRKDNRNSKPCKDCEKILKKFKVKKVCYSI